MEDRSEVKYRRLNKLFVLVVVPTLHPKQFACFIHYIDLKKRIKNILIDYY